MKFYRPSHVFEETWVLSWYTKALPNQSFHSCSSDLPFSHYKKENSNHRHAVVSRSPLKNGFKRQEVHHLSHTQGHPSSWIGHLAEQQIRQLGRDPPACDEVLQLAAGVDGILWGTYDKLNAEVLDAAGPNLKAISTYSAGLNHVDIVEVKRRSHPTSPR